jgi:DNA (cytosine-5)-methyltransferase 1
VVWENVPGVFSSVSDDLPDPRPPDIDLDGGDGPADGEEVVVEDEHDGLETHALGCFLAGLQELGYGVSYRSFDAQYFGLAQRRERLFVAGCLGDWRGAAAVLFEPEGLRGDPAPRRTAGKGFAHELAPCIGASGRGFDRAGETRGQDPVVAEAVALRGHSDYGPGLPCLRAESGDCGGGSEALVPVDITNLTLGDDVSGCLEAAQEKGNRGQGVMAVAIQERAVSENPEHGPQGKGYQEGVAYTLESRQTPQAVAFSCKDPGADAAADQSPTLRAMDHDGSHANGGGQVAVAFETRCARNGRGMPSEVVPALKAEAGQTGKGDAAPCVAVAFSARARGDDGRGYARGEQVFGDGVVGALDTVKPHCVAAGEPGTRNAEHGTAFAVRRLTPRECERLQGFPDDYTAIPWRGKRPEDCPDGPRYKALGNSWAVPCARWIGERIQAVHGLMGFRASEAGEKSFPKVGSEQHETEMVKV